MARSGKYKKHKSETDPIFGNKLVTKFINCLMFDGKKSTAQRMFYQAMTLIQKKNMDPLQVFLTAINNVCPKMEVRPKRVGGASYMVPMEVRGERRISLAIRWLLAAANTRSNKQYHTISEKLADEFIDAYSSTGEAIKKRDIMHRNAEANKAFAHFRW